MFLSTRLFCRRSFIWYGYIWIAQVIRGLEPAIDVQIEYVEVPDNPSNVAKISGHVENSKAFSRYRDIDEETAKETIMKLE